MAHHPSSPGAAADGLRDVRWVSRLSKNRAGQLLQNHLANLKNRLATDGHDSAVQCCVDNRRSLLYAILVNAKRGKNHPCGLPKPMPRFVAVVNLSGERLLLYSNSDALVRKLCARSSALHAQELQLQLQQFADWVNLQHSAGASTQESFVVITYQLPWQGGIGSAYWEVNTAILTRGANVLDSRIFDRTKSLSSVSTRVFSARPSLADLESIPTPSGAQIDLLPTKQIVAFRDNYAASCLDHDTDDDNDETHHHTAENGAAAVPTGSTSAKGDVSLHQYNSHRDEIVRNVNETHRKLRAQNVELTKEIDKLKETHKTEKESAEANFEARLSKQADEHAEVHRTTCAKLDLATVELEGNRLQLGRLMKELSQSKSAHDKVVAAVSKSKTQFDAQNRLSNSQNQKLLRERNELEEKLSAQRAMHRKTLTDLSKTHSRDLERSVEDEQRKVVAVNDKLFAKDRLMNQLAEINDRKDTELKAIQAQLQASFGLRNAEDKCAIVALCASLRDAESELLEERQSAAHIHVRMATAEAEVMQAKAEVLEAKAAKATKAAGVPEPSVACCTDTIATATHECASTQTTEQSRVLPEHLPTSVKVLAKVDDALCVVAGTHDGAARVCGADTTVGEDASPGSSTGLTNAQTAHATIVQQQQQQRQQQRQQQHRSSPPPAETTAPHFHALTALSAVQWLVQWTSDAAFLSASPPPHGGLQHQFCHSQLYAPPSVYPTDGQYPHWRGEFPFAQFPLQHQQHQQHQQQQPQQPTGYDCSPSPASSRPGTGRGRPPQLQPRHHHHHHHHDRQQR